jgi:hypothetical protein
VCAATSGWQYRTLLRQLVTAISRDDRLWVNSGAKTCQQYLAAEFHHVGATNRDCGGRTPNYDAVDVFRSLLVRGRTTGVADGVTADDRLHSETQFPFLAAP